jgi:hypothetical protein
MRPASWPTRYFLHPLGPRFEELRFHLLTRDGDTPHRRATSAPVISPSNTASTDRVFSSAENFVRRDLAI